MSWDAGATWAPQKKNTGLGQLNQSLFKVESFWRVFDTVEKKLETLEGFVNN